MTAVVEQLGTGPLLLALVATQCLLHGLGWTMASHFTHAWRREEGQFAGFWLLFSAGLFVHALSLPSTSPIRSIGNLLIVLAVVFHYRGLALHWKQPPHDRRTVGLFGLMVTAIGLSFMFPNGYAWRVAIVCSGIAALLFSMVALISLHGRRSPWFAGALAAGLFCLGGAVASRAAVALLGSVRSDASVIQLATGSVPLTIAVMLAAGMVHLAHGRFTLIRGVERLAAQAETDPLTGVLNRRGLMARLERVHPQPFIDGRGYVVLMVDIDHFKALNDRYGHDVGDQVLARVAQALMLNLRVGDIVARMGGEEFCVLLPRTPLDASVELAQRLLRCVAQGGSPGATISIGVAEAQADESAAEVLKRADVALYKAKHAGRNRVDLAMR